MQCLAKDLSADPAAGMGGRCVPKVLSAAKGANYCKSLLPRSAKGQALKVIKLAPFNKELALQHGYVL